MQQIIKKRFEKGTQWTIAVDYLFLKKAIKDQKDAK